MKYSMMVRLCLMMFLQYFAWGSWFDTIPLFMSAHGMADLTQWPYTMYAVASIVAPFFVGLVADRYFPTERVLALLHLLGGLVMLGLPSLAGSRVGFVAGLLAYNLCYMPTVALATSLAFHHITDQERQFPIIRVFGTIAWIASGLFISFAIGRMVTGLLPEESSLTLTTAGVAGIVLAGYALTLPHTPPQGRGKDISFRGIAGLDALAQLGSRSFFVLIVCAMLMWVPLTSYYNYLGLYMDAAGIGAIAATQKLGQASEVVFMLLMPLFFRRLGVKWMLAIGMIAWVVRYSLFAGAASMTGNPMLSMIILGILLHGVSFDFFFVTLQIYVDKRSTPEIRGQAQGFLVLVTYGFGFLMGSQIGGWIYNNFLDETKLLDPNATRLTLEQFGTFWWVPAACVAVIFVIFALLFKDDTVAHNAEKAGAAHR